MSEEAHTTVRKELVGDEMALVAVEFSLGDVVFFESLRAGTINSNHSLETTSGRYLVRINVGKAESDVVHEAALVTHLRASGVSTPDFVRSASRTPYGWIAGEIVSVLPWVEGHHADSFSITPIHCSALGRALAQIHQSSETLDSSLQVSSRYSADDLRSRLEQISRCGDAQIEKLHPRLRRDFEELEKQRSTIPLRGQGLIHGDLFPDNVLFGDREEVVALLDFEQACWGGFARDLAVAVNACCFSSGFEDDRANALIDAYNEVMVLPPTEEFLLELRRSALRFTLTRITDVHLAGRNDLNKDFQRFLMRLDHWQSAGAMVGGFV